MWKKKKKTRLQSSVTTFHVSQLFIKEPGCYIAFFAVICVKHVTGAGWFKVPGGLCLCADITVVRWYLPWILHESLLFLQDSILSHSY